MTGRADWRRAGRAVPAVIAGAVLVGCAGPLAPVTDRDATAIFRRPPSMNVAAELSAGAEDRRPPPSSDGVSAEPGASGSPGSNLAELIADAIARHPQVAADTEAWRRAIRRIGAVGLPHPSLSAEQARTTLLDQRAEEAEKGDFEQEIPWPGAVDRLDAAWGPPVREAWYRLVLTRLAVTREVRSIVYEVSGLEAALELVEERLRDLQALARTAATRTESAPPPPAGSDELDAAVQDLQQRSQALRAMRPILLATLNTAMGRPGNAPLPKTISPPSLVVVSPASALVRTALATNPTLLVLRDRREDERVQAAAARSQLLPRFTLGVQGVFINEPDDVNTPMGAEAPVRITLGVSVPLWSEHDNASVRGVVTRRLDIADEFISARATLAAEVETLSDTHRDADRRATELQRTLVPAARSAWREARATYVEDGGPLADMLAVHRALLDRELDLIRARVDRGVTLARLEESVGGSVATRMAGE